MNSDAPLIKEGDAAEAFALYQQIPEFSEAADFGLAEIERRLARPASLALTSVIDGQPKSG